MKVFGKHYQTIWLDENDDKTIKIIDQRWLPHKFFIEEIRTFAEMCTAIKDMHLRGAGIIGVAACYGMYLAALESEDSISFDECISNAAIQILDTRPTAINLKWGIDKSIYSIKNAKTNREKIEAAKSLALCVANEETETCKKIGQYGLELIEDIFTKRKGETVNILTHCNAGWLAFVDYGTALAPIYLAHQKGIKVHVWVDETRPRNQGASLTAWELGMEGVPYTLIVDNAGGHLMQNKMVDMVIVGTDRTTLEGAVVNKTGTYLKALAAKDNNIAFYVALPTSSIDWNIANSGDSIPIEKRSPDEVNFVWGLNANKEISKVRITSENTEVLNYGFDITPARLITKLITEKGIIDADLKSISTLKTK